MAQTHVYRNGIERDRMTITAEQLAAAIWHQKIEDKTSLYLDGVETESEFSKLELGNVRIDGTVDLERVSEILNGG